MNKIKTFREFWPFYLVEHRSSVNRYLHFFGTFLTLIVYGAAVVHMSWKIVLLAPVLGYFFAWVGHFCVEKNRPATFTYPLWSLMADYWMFFYFMTGRLGKEFKRHGIRTI